MITAIATCNFAADERPTLPGRLRGRYHCISVRNSMHGGLPFTGEMMQPYTMSVPPDCKRALGKDRRKCNTANRSTAIVCWWIRLIPESARTWRLQSRVLQSVAKDIVRLWGGLFSLVHAQSLLNRWGLPLLLSYAHQPSFTK